MPSAENSVQSVSLRVDGPLEEGDRIPGVAALQHDLAVLADHARIVGRGNDQLSQHARRRVEFAALAQILRLTERGVEIDGKGHAFMQTRRAGADDEPANAIGSLSGRSPAHADTMSAARTIVMRRKQVAFIAGVLPFCSGTRFCPMGR